ncbi:hypothetical protein FisN_8Lh149 [Fistulifera solaris]|uniref:Bromo domain-containing protein n=1 Tax=Fistulifera solaris TaxID=1519565 RepID=A0A1Z5JDJ8_FISSO|nr:hypothetical protein FisN_8Lh149 [Fistulifera solaris]|eukprot:GAX12049.1 hypothetical protein FisN_8Lh149 [Fistulifera solaris]
MTTRPAKKPKIEELPWTRDHHLIGNTITRTVLDRSFDNKYQKVSTSLPIQYFQPEDATTRKPALWRALYCSSSEALACDAISADLLQSSSTEAGDLSAVVKHRLQTVLYQHVVQNWIPPLVMAAILEECQAVLLTHILRQQQQSPATNGAASSSFPYYHQSPNSYLPTTNETRMLEDGSSTLLPVKLTPGQLVARIKQGCALLWQQQDRQSVFLPTNTRSSRRLAQQQQPTSEETNETNELWKVVPGGKIATYLQEHLIHRADNSLEEEADDNGAEEEMEDEETDLLTNNPYLKLPSDAIMEWLGKKTAKLLSASDLEDAMSALIYNTPKGKKKPKLSGLDLYQAAPQLDDSLANLIPPALWKYICNLEDAKAQDDDWHDARLSLVSLEDQSADAGQMSRRPFQVKVVWAPEVAIRRNDQNAAQLADAQEEAKNARNWATWRHKGIHGGYTVWSSWLQAVEKWQNEQDRGNGEVTLNGTETLSEPSADRIPSEGDTGKTEMTDEQIAKELEAMAGSRRSRRSEKGGGGGIFYGTQSNMTPKQVMDALLRLVSQSKYQTTAALIAAVPDESSDPLRRIRGAIGKLLWKRNQLSKLEVQTEWTDAPAWESLKDAGLITIDSTKIIDDRIDPNEVTALVNYIRELHRTELRLRRMLLENLTEVPIPVIATAADEKAGSMESMDAMDFEEESAASIQWLASGHDLLDKVIFRPPVSSQIDTIAACEWFRIVDFAEVVESPQVEDPSLQERPQIGLAKESRVVERRRRFHAESVDGGSFTERLVLTEGQVLAGLKAAQLEEKRMAGDPASPDYKGPRTNPFAGSKYPEITLVAPENFVAQNISGVVAAHDSKVDANGSLEQRILVVPDHGKEFWAALVFADNGSIIGRIEGDKAKRDYIVQQFEYHSGSQAYEECRAIVKFLERHAKAGPFLEPVDPVALNIPTYFSVIKNPMDISTLSANLESGKYSTIPPNQARGRTSVARMLNGPFRTDVDLIFDNAMLFNPPGDWIHQEASALKKAVTRKFDLAVSTAETGGRSQPRQSVYSEYESDVDMYEYESDADDDFVASGRSRRKRNQSSAQAPVKEDASSRAVERPVRLQKILSEQGVRGSLTNMPISTDVSTFSLPPGWTCRARIDEGAAENSETHLDSNGLDEIIALHAAIEEQEASNVRRSTRTHQEDDVQEKGSNKSRKLEFYDMSSTSSTTTIKNRLQLELECERNHETRFAKMYHKLLKLVDCSEVGLYAEGSFPPYLGRVVPLSTNYDLNDAGSQQWEIRETYLVPALRWVLRGLIHSEHVHEYESVETAKDSGTILPNHVYYLDPQLEPLDVVDSKELTRRKRATNAAAEESSDEDVELSAYEKMRAERVSRNAERLKALGLA